MDICQWSPTNTQAQVRWLTMRNLQRVHSIALEATSTTAIINTIGKPEWCLTENDLVNSDASSHEFLYPQWSRALRNKSLRASSRDLHGPNDVLGWPYGQSMCTKVIETHQAAEA